jgi:UDP-N-acetylmuramyl pentapeptide phosphotransferase/UDP-N-acetylglucosamine-1-phosphate transferase
MALGMPVVFSAALAASSAVICAALIVLIRPWLQRHALAQPNARSSHQVPTPQGGGIAVIAATIAVSFGASFFLHTGAASTAPPAMLVAAVVVMAGIGAAADLHPIDVAPRLVLQVLAVAAMIYGLPAELRVVPALPWWGERILLVIGGMWFVNLVNFMDGLDWMTVAEIVPLTTALAALGFFGLLPPQAVIASLALCGAMIGFAYFNRPLAKLFLGDVGSLPIGLILCWLLVLVAGNGGRAAALLLPLYYLADSTVTLLRRLVTGERIWQAHRTHFYQRATDGGFSVIDVIARVFVVNLALCALAVATVILPGRLNDVAAVLVGAALVVWLLIVFARGKKARLRPRAS